MHAVIDSPLQFLCILLLEETFVQVQVLQQRVPGPRKCGTLTTGPRGNSHPSVPFFFFFNVGFLKFFFHLFLLVGD